MSHISTAGGATNVVVHLSPMRDAMYHALTGELIDGRKEAIHQFIDKKNYKPGLGAYAKSKSSSG